MKEIYKQNLLFLKKRNPELSQKLLKVTINKNRFKFIDNPVPNILIDKKTVHSRINPLSEADKLISDINTNRIGETTFLFLGLGIGYQIKKFMEKYKDIVKYEQIVVIEKNLESFKLLVENLDVFFLEKAKLFIDENLNVIESYFNSINPMQFGGYRIIKLQGSVIEDTEYYSAIEHMFKIIISSKLSNILTRYSFETLWLKNIVENISHLHYSLPVNALKDKGKGSTALLVGAGPSLYSQLMVIKKIDPKPYIISVDTALNSLLKSEIIPDIVVTLDAQYHSLYDFTYLFSEFKNQKKPILVYDLLACPKIVKRFKNNSFFTSSLNIFKNQSGNLFYIDNPLVDYIKHIISPFDSLLCGGSVITTVMELAIYMDFSKIILVGADLSFTQFKTHVNSSPLPNMFLNSSNRLSSIITKNIDIISKRKIFLLSGIKSTTVYTDYVLMSYRDWIESQRKYNKRIINSTYDGLNISNLTYKELEKSTEYSSKRLKLEIDNSLLPPRKQLLKNLLLELEKDMDYLLRNIKLREFSYNDIWKKLPYLNNLIIDVRKIFNNNKKVNNYLYMFAIFLKKIIDKSIK